MLNIIQLKKMRLSWSPSGNPEYPFKVRIDEINYEIRINDFPEEALYSIISGGLVLGDLDDWPINWERKTRRP